MFIVTRSTRLQAFLVVGAIAAAAPAARADEQLRVGVSIPAAIAFVPLQVGIETGIFKKHGLDIMRADLGGAARAQQALAAESLDIVIAGGPDLALVAKGQYALAVGVITTGPRQTTLIVRNDNPMKSPEELKGKTVGISTAGGLSDWVVRQLSRKLGFGAQGIRAVGLGQDSAQVAALRTGQIDATVMDFASGLWLEELGSGRIFLREGLHPEDDRADDLCAEEALGAASGGGAGVPRRLVRNGRLHARRQGSDDPYRCAAHGRLAGGRRQGL